MSIVPQRALSADDIAVLGNNVLPSPRSRVRRRLSNHRRQIGAINRSLACIGERVTTLHRPLAVVS